MRIRSISVLLALVLGLLSTLVATTAYAAGTPTTTTVLSVTNATHPGQPIVAGIDKVEVLIDIKVTADGSAAAGMVMVADETGPLGSAMVGDTGSGTFGPDGDPGPYKVVSDRAFLSAGTHTLTVQFTAPEPWAPSQTTTTVDVVDPGAQLPVEVKAGAYGTHSSTSNPSAFVVNKDEVSVGATLVSSVPVRGGTLKVYEGDTYLGSAVADAETKMVTIPAPTLGSHTYRVDTPARLPSRPDPEP